MQFLIDSPHIASCTLFYAIMFFEADPTTFARRHAALAGENID
jgi:hypothetical protein